MRILFLSGWYPFPANNGSKIRIYNLIQGLSEHHELTLLSFTERGQPVADAPSFCQDVYTVVKKPFDPGSWRARLGYLSPRPRLVADVYSAEMARHIERLLSTNRYDLVIASQFDMAMYSTCFQGAPAILEELELGTYYEAFVKARGWRRWRNGLTWLKHKRWVAGMLKDFSACTVVSTLEQKLAQKAVPDYGAFEIIPNCVAVEQYNGVCESPQPNTLVFTGSFSYYPNYDAMCWFIAKVLPLIQREVPDVQLTITGNTAGYSLPPAENVVMTGYVDDVRPYIARSWASLVPIRYGGGTRLKILEAMALHTPVIATSKGAEGLDLCDGQHLLLADTPEDFAQAVVQVLRQPVLRQQLADKAYAVTCTQYDWQVVLPRFLDLVDRVAAGLSHL